MAEKFLAWPSREEIVTLLAGFGAGTPFAMFAHGLLFHDRIVAPTLTAHAAAILVPALIMSVVVYRVNGSIEWTGGEANV